MSRNWIFSSLRVTSVERSKSFYAKYFGLHPLINYTDPKSKLSKSLLLNLPYDVVLPETNSLEAFELAFGGEVDFLELAEDTTNPGAKYDTGNVEPKRGFGHVAFLCNDVYTACTKLESAGVLFQKKPDEGRMKGLAFALDPDGYWIEIIKRAEDSGLSTEYNLAQTMLRVKDAKKSLEFYQEHMGMKLIGEKHFEEAKFSLFFLSSKTPEGLTEENGWDIMKKMQNPVLELTHNHGTEDDPDFSYYARDPNQAFSHIGFLVDNLKSTETDLKGKGVAVLDERKEDLPTVTVEDPDGYKVVLYEVGSAKTLHDLLIGSSL